MDLDDRMLNNIQIDDLVGDARIIAEAIGLEAFRRLVRAVGGSSPYIPKRDNITIPARNRMIVAEYNGYNAKELARRYDLSYTALQCIVKDKRDKIMASPMDGQLAMDDLELQ